MKPVRVLAVGALAVIGVTLSAAPAHAHGTMSSPVSRSYVCYAEGPENPSSELCKAVVGAGGPQPMYDWNEVNIGDAAGRHRQLIPDGKLCSAGRDKYRGLDLARADWPTTTLPAGAQTTFTFAATAPHRGAFELYITKDGYDPTKPLAWSDLESAPFLTVTDPTLSGGAYVMSGAIPANKRGRHLIYAIWQRSDSPEAFYSCSDVMIGAGSPTSSSPAAIPTQPAENHSHAPTSSASATSRPTSPASESTVRQQVATPPPASLSVSPSAVVVGQPTLPVTGNRSAQALAYGIAIVAIGAAAIIGARRLRRR